MDHGIVFESSGTPSLADLSPYHYVPSRTAAIVFLSFFGFSTLLHLGQATRYRTWWLLPTACFCGVIEILGWSGRLWSSFSPLLTTPYQIQTICTIIAPTPLLAVNFALLEDMIKRLGSDYSRLSPKWHTRIFTTCEVISLVVQSIGSGLDAAASDLKGEERAIKIMLGGVTFQLAVIVFYSALAIEFFTRYHLHAPFSTQNKENGVQLRGEFTTKLRLMSYTLLFTTTLLFIRAIFRTLELTQGPAGKIISNELYFNVLDGSMVTIAMYTLNIAHPGILLSVSQNKPLDVNLSSESV